MYFISTGLGIRMENTLFDYDMTVIIPVYNAASFLERCVKSLLNQTHPFARIEILMINDGSTDGSGEICRALERKYKNLKVIEQVNAGVSAARNLGIQNARGKYILFLDADDRLSDNAVEEFFLFMESHYEEVDIASCPIFNDTDGVLSPHIRNPLITQTRVYNVDEDIYMSQTNINVCVKNLGKKNVLFDTAMEMGEDEKRNNTIVMQKRKIGYCHRAAYYYTRHAGSASRNKNHPYYSFNNFMNYYEGLFEQYKTEKGVHPYIQAIVLYGLSWRIKSDLLFPYHLEGAPKDAAYDRIFSLMEKIDNLIIVNSPYVDYFHRLFFIGLKKHEQFKLTQNRYGYCITAGDGTLCYMEGAFRVTVTKVRVDKNRLFITGFTASPATELLEPRLFAHLGSGAEEPASTEELTLKESSYSRVKSKIKTNRFYCFEYSFKLSDSNELRFEAQINGVRYKVMMIFLEKAQINRNRRFFYQNGYTVRANGNSLLSIKKAGLKDKVLTLLALDKFYLKLNLKIFIYRKATILKPRRKIWIYCDRQDIFDNAYIQFKHDFLKKDGIKRYYITDKLKNPEAYFTRKERRRLVKFKSLKHRLLYINCDKILTSFASSSIVTTFDPITLQWISDLLKYEVIYLQHGVLHAGLPLMYSKERCEADRIVVSSGFEMKNFTEKYGYYPKDLIPCGMPRYDKVDTQTPPQPKILFSPSWRCNLIGEYIDNKRQLKEAAFLSSDFYKSINEFLNSKELGDLLDRYDITLDFKNHPTFADYIKHFHCDNPRVNILGGGEIRMEDYLVMITDFSSIVFDFVYLERPVLYFVPDYTLFKAGVTHNYRELDIPIEDGFGEFTQTAAELIESLRRLAENKFQPAPQYAEKMKGFFLDRGKSHSDKLYEALMKE